MKGKSLLIILGCLFLFLLPQMINAATLPEFELSSNNQATVGENINVNVLVKGNPGTLNYDITNFYVKYDENALEYVSFNGSNVFGFTKTTTGTGNIKFLSSYVANATGTYKVNTGDSIGVVTFKVKDTTLSSTTLSYYSSYESDYGNGTKTLSIVKSSTNNDNNTTNNNTTVNDNNTTTDTNNVNTNDNNLVLYIVIGGMFVVIAGLLIYIISTKKKENDAVKF